MVHAPRDALVTARKDARPVAPRTGEPLPCPSPLPCEGDGAMTAWRESPRSRVQMKLVTRFAPSPTGRLHLGHAFSALLAHDFAREPRRRLPAQDRGYRPGPLARRACRRDHRGSRLARHRVGRRDPLPVRAAGPLPRGARPAEGGGPRLSLLLHPLRHRRRDRRQRRRPARPRRPALPRHLPRAVAGGARAAHGGRSRMPGGSTWRSAAAAGRARSTGATATPRSRPSRRPSATSSSPARTRRSATISPSPSTTAAQGVTDVVRGRDLYAATDVHRLLQALLGLPTPLYHHHPLLLGADGRRLAKRHGAPTLRELREAGADPKALAADLLDGTNAVWIFGRGRLDRRDEHLPRHPDRPRRRSDPLRPRQGRDRNGVRARTSPAHARRS